MGRIAFWIAYLFYTLPADSRDNISVAYNKGIPAKDLKIILQLIDENWNDLIKQIDDSFMGKNSSIIELKMK